MRVVALTGTVAAGKSAVAALFQRWGATLIDADAIVRELQRTGQPVLAAIVARFGPGILLASGELDRARLRQLMLADDGARRDLEAIVHPAVEQRRRELLAAAEARGDRVVIVEIPLLFEVAARGAYQDVIVVDAPRPERRRRLIADRHLAPEEADRLLDAQLPPELKRAGATWVIDNDAGRDTLEQRARAVWQELNR
jgi:dephospho-CoA kinase